jgi:hypothetical protein
MVFSAPTTMAAAPGRPVSGPLPRSWKQAPHLPVAKPQPLVHRLIVRQPHLHGAIDLAGLTIELQVTQSLPRVHRHAVVQRRRRQSHDHQLVPYENARASEPGGWKGDLP